jgi:hypothetical protein
MLIQVWRLVPAISGIKNNLFRELVARKKGSFSNLENAGNFSLNSNLIQMIPHGGYFDAGFTV